MVVWLPASPRVSESLGPLVAKLHSGLGMSNTGWDNQMCIAKFS